MRKAWLQCYYSRFYFALKRYIDNRYWICLLGLRIRSLLVLSPLGNLVRTLHQKYGTSEPLKVGHKSLFPNVDVTRVVNNINKYGYSLGIDLPDECLARILNFCETKELIEHENPHQQCETIHKIAHDKKITDIARRYLGSEPKLWFTAMYCSVPGARREGNILYRTHPSFFHYDVLDFKALTLFVYLTDVDECCAPHLIIPQTHREKSLAKMLSPLIGTDTVSKRYGTEHKVILGPKGTGFFEDAIGYHKRSEVCKRPRLILRISYTLLRGPRPHKITQGRQATIQTVAVSE